MSISIPLVGMQFRPPAKEVLSILPIGMPLEIRPEPENQYDVNAVMVLVDMGDFPVNLIPLLDNILPSVFDAMELCSNGPLHLGYLAATGMKTAKGGPGNTGALMLASVHGIENLIATLGSAPEGYPVVTISVKE
jgi:hypothetical protein